jgi:glycogen synthase
LRAGRQVRVLMLGWEYPPRLAGGLGKACQGLSQAMANQGAEVIFVLPTFPERIAARHLEVVGAREALIEAGWDPDRLVTRPKVPIQLLEGKSFMKPAESKKGKASHKDSSGNISIIRSEAQMAAYGAHPEGPIPDNLLRMIDHVSNIEPVFSALPRAEVTETAKIRPIAQKIENTNKSSPPETPTIPASEIYGKNLWTEIERFCFTVRHLTESHEVDVVHAHDWMTFPAAFEFQRMTGAPVFLHVHATEYDRSGENVNHDVFRIERNGFRRATHIFAVSRYTAGIVERFYGVPKSKISVIYNAPDDETFTPIAEAGGVRQQQVVFLGRLTFQKGPEYFLKAAALVAKADPTARFVFCGTGDMFDHLRHQAHRMGVEKVVHFAGFIEPAGVDEILVNSKVLVMPSVSEPFGLVALEAIRCGIPVILSKQSGVKEVLQRALQVDFWDHEKLADQILAALRLSGLSKQLVDEGRDQVRQLSWDKSAHQVIYAYRKQLGSTYAQVIGGAHGH